MKNRFDIRRTLALVAIALPAPAFAWQAPPAAPAAPSAPTTPAAPAAPAAPARPATPAAPAGPRAIAFEGEKPSAKEIFTKHLDAIGGAKAMKSKESMVAIGSMEIPAAQLKGSMRTVARVPASVVIAMDLPGIGATSSGFDGTTGWTVDPMRGPSIMGAKEVAQVRRDGDFLRDLRLAEEPEGEVTGLFDFDGKPCWAVTVPGRDGAAATQNYYERETGLMRGMSMTASTPMGELPVTVVTDEYKDFGGIKLATRTTTKVMGQVQVMTVDAVEWNSAKDSDFDLPAEIKALRDAAPAPASAPKAP